MNQPIQRKFVRPGLISEYLKCPICMDVFSDAIRLFCGHTFCQSCLDDFLKNSNTCPECRTYIDIKNSGFDLLARQIINELEVFCPMQDCPWKGMSQQLEQHFNLQCKFSKEQYLNKNMKKNQKKEEKNKIAWSQFVDDQIMDKINQNIAKGSLEARVLAKTSSLKTAQTAKIELLNQIQEKNQNNAKSKTSNFNFLESLFD